MQLQKASRKKVKIRGGFSGASGFGKTYSALLFAKGLVGDWSKIAVIDTENDSASLYSHLGDFNTLPLTPKFTPERYIEAINLCVKSGMECIIIDSITHEWDGKGGCLEIVEELGGRYQDWAKVTPRHQSFIEAITQCPVHVLTTVRRKQDYEMTKDNNGKIKVEKGGTKEITREGFEYELTFNLELINDKNIAKASKDRTGLFSGKPEFKVTEKTGEMVREWCELGNEPLPSQQPITENEVQELLRLIETSTYDEKQREQLRGKVKSFAFKSDYLDAKGKLSANQLNANDSVANPSQGQINKHLKETIQ